MVTDSILAKAVVVTNLIIAVAPRTPHCRRIFSKPVCHFSAVAEIRVSSVPFSETYNVIPAACNNTESDGAN